MTFDKFVREYATIKNISHAEARRRVEEVFSLIRLSVGKEGESLAVHDFGKFSITKVKARTGVSPKGPYTVPEHLKLKFKPAPELSRITRG